LFHISGIERGHYKTNGCPAILFVPHASNYDPICLVGVCLPRKINQSTSEIRNTHKEEMNGDDQTKGNCSFTRTSTLTRLHTPEVYASAVMKASKQTQRKKSLQRFEYR
jgi:hypothetical protein